MSNLKSSYCGLFLFIIGLATSHVESRGRRSIDLIAAHTLISDSRLPREVTPNSYRLELDPCPETGTFKGRVRINITWQETTDKITLHAHQDLQISHSEVTVIQLASDDETSKLSSVRHSPMKLKIHRTENLPKKPLYVVQLERALNRGAQCEVDITFAGKLVNETSEGLFRNSYVDSTTGERKWFVATHLRPNLARRVFPCFDEPAYKVPFVISVSRCQEMVALSNMPLERTEEMPEKPEWVWDHFQESPPMSTFTVAILVSHLNSIVHNSTDKTAESSGVEIKVWGRPDFMVALQNATDKIERSLKFLQDFWGVPYKLPKLDCIALPNYQATRPADNWGLIFFKESELSSKGIWQITHELVYQWLGTLATPFWWSDAHINNALARYVTTYATLKISQGNETFHNWPMTMLYSIYYEFSKRYPHGKITAIKQDSGSTKTELIFRMFNYTIGEKTLIHGLQRFIADRQFKTFFGDDIWGAITEQARFDNTLEETITVNEIAASWITKDRLPVLNVTRNYEDNTANLIQHIYLRERPHDVPDQDKFLWWIPVVMVTQEKLNFSHSIPKEWMRKQRNITLQKLPGPDQFVIINPEEIGPFPVNYDTKNWNMLAQFLLKSNDRNKIPVNTRAKLIHDAWNLAYAGDLSFATALNMTLFLRYEREYLAWDPVFTMIDHIGRHIDSSDVHKKFQTYVRLLLTPLYEELGSEPQEGECEGRAQLRNSAKIFLCQAGYRPCIQEAQNAFDKWMKIENPDEGNPVANQYICPVFKWGTKEEWEFGLQRVINFPPSRKQNERTYLLKTLAGCPIDSWKVDRLLSLTILEENGNFTENDVFLIFSMLTGGANGYTTLFNFLNSHWDAIKIKFENKPQLWNSMVSSATSVFKTQEGLDMVSKLYVERRSEFGTAEFFIEKALKNIREETKWSDDNLPIIEKWLDDYLQENKAEATQSEKFM